MACTQYLRSMRRPEPAPLWHTGAWWVTSVLVALVHNGLWATPNLGFMATIAQNPGSNPFSGALPGDYLLTSISMPSLAALFGQTAPHEVARLHMVVLIVAWAALVALARLRFGAVAARNLTVLLAAAPIVTVSMQWLGQPDPLTAACGIAMVLVARRRHVVALGVLAGLTHPEQAAFMALVATGVRALLPPRDRVAAAEPGDHDGGSSPAGPGGQQPGDAAGAGGPRSLATDAVAAVGGVVLGRALTQVWFWIRDITILTPRSAYVDSGLGTFWRHHTQEPLAVLWSLWGPLWLVIIAAVALGVSHRLTGRLGGDAPAGALRAWSGMALLAGVALAPVMLTLDETRVYAVITAPLLAGAAIWSARALTAAVATRGAIGLLVVTALLPGVMATGTTSSRGDLDTPSMIRFLVNGSVPSDYRDPGAEPRITEWLLGPFDIVLDDPGS